MTDLDLVVKEVARTLGEFMGCELDLYDAEVTA